MNQARTHEEIRDFLRLEQDNQYFINKIYPDIENYKFTNDLLTCSDERTNTYIDKKDLYGKTQAIVVAVLKTLIFEDYKTIVILSKNKAERDGLREEIKEKLKLFSLGPKILDDLKSNINFDNGNKIYFVSRPEHTRGMGVSKYIIIADKWNEDYEVCIIPMLNSRWSSCHIFADKSYSELKSFKKLEE